MTDIYKLFEDEIWKPEDFTSCLWAESGNEVIWNIDNNLKDLVDMEGATYSDEVFMEVDQRDNYVMYILRDCCGGKYQAIFDLRNKQEF